MTEEEATWRVRDYESIELMRITGKPITALRICDTKGDLQCVVKPDGTWEYGPTFDPETALASLFTGIGYGYADGEKAVAKLKAKHVRLLEFLQHIGDAIAASYQKDDE